MSRTAETQIRDVFVELDELQTVVTVEDVIHAAGPVRPITPPTHQHVERRWSLRPVWIAAAAAIVLVALVAAPLLWAGSNDAPPATTPPTVVTTSAPETATTLPASPDSTPPSTVAPTVPEPPPDASRSRVTFTEGDGPSEGSSAGGSRFVVVEYDGESIPKAWLSGDGLDWEVTDLSQFSYVALRAAIDETILLRTDAGYVTTNDFLTFDPWSAPVLEQGPDAGSTAGPYSAVGINDNSLILARGGREAFILMDEGFSNPAVLHPTFGRDVESLEEAAVTINKLVATDGRFYVLLDVYDPDSDRDPGELWSSADGITWDQIPTDIPPWHVGTDPGAASQLAARGNQVLLFVGTGRGPITPAWWLYREVTNTLEPTDGPRLRNDVTLVATESGYLTGSSGPVYVTSDGSSWQTTDLFGSLPWSSSVVGDTILSAKEPGTWDLISLSPAG